MTLAACDRFALRPVTAEDRPFLMAVYGSTREEELRPVPWTAEQKQAFIEMQFTAQDAHWNEVYPLASRDVILVDGTAAGRLYVHRGPADIRIVDIALLPPFRGGGVGRALLTGLLDEAKSNGRTVSIHVERMNPALRLYERLGFRTVEDKGVYLLMKWGGTDAIS